MNLQETRKAKGLTRKQLALMVGCSESMIVKIERGEKSPSMNTAGRISKALGKTVDKLFFAKK